MLRQVLNKLEQALDSPAYNYIIHTAPFDHQELPHYHWHIEIIPRLTKVAGFEWGSGFYINPVPPEDAAGFLRDVEVAAPRRRRGASGESSSAMRPQPMSQPVTLTRSDWTNGAARHGRYDVDSARRRDLETCN